MAYPGIGFKSYMQLAKESTWGTDLASLWKMPVLFIRPEPGASIIKSENLFGTITRGAMYKGPQLPRVTVGFEVNYESEAFMLLLDLAMGTQAYGAIGAQTTGPSGGVYTHVFKNEEFINSATLELVEGNIAASTAQQLVGAKIEELTLEVAWAQDNSCILRGTVVFVGKTYSTGATPTGGTTVPQSNYPMLFSHIGTKDVGATTTPTLRSMTFKIKNNLAMRPNLGSLYQDEPVRGGFVDLSFDFSCDFTSTQALAEFIAATQGSPQIAFANSIGNDTFTIDMPKGYITAHDHAVEGPGVLEQKFTWEAIDDAASPSSGVTLTLANAIAAVV